MGGRRYGHDREDPDDDREPSPSPQRPARSIRPETRSARSIAYRDDDDVQRIGIKTFIMQLVIRNTRITTDEVIAEMKRVGYGKVSRVTVGNIRMNCRHAITVLNASGKLRGISL